MASFDYYADDEDISVPKTGINALLAKPYLLEILSAGFLTLFFTVTNVICQDAPKRQ